tara:strand:- start:4834 stop:5631 length:798 start_codon:yes stop_codon:yes gene_type:complete
MYNTKNYRITSHDLEYDENGIPKRRYINNDPGEPGAIDRPGWEYLSLDDPYAGYRDMVWTPIDLPKLDVDLDQIYSLHQNIQRRQRDFYETENVGTLMFLKPNRCGCVGVDEPWYDWAEQEFPHVVDYVKKLPFLTIHQCFFVQSAIPIPVHYDEELAMQDTLRAQAPSHLHLRWSRVTDWREEYFYMSKNSGATRVFPMLPPETNAFAYDGATYEHGVEKGFQFNERAQLVIHGVYDLPKWHELLENSWQKYKQYAITTEHFDL